MICNDKMIILIFLNVNKIDVVKAKINMYQGYDQCWLNLRSYTNIKLNDFFINFMITKYKMQIFLAKCIQNIAHILLTYFTEINVQKQF